MKKTAPHLPGINAEIIDKVLLHPQADEDGNKPLIENTEQELLKANERYHLIARATNDAVWDWDIKSNRIWGNNRYRELLGYNLHTGLNDYDYFINKIHPADRERVNSNFNIAIEKKVSSISEEFQCKVLDGSYRVFYDRAYLQYGPDGKLYRMSGAMLDITDRKKTEQALEESENHVRTIVNSEPECIKLLSASGELLEMNPAGLAMIEADHLDQVKGKKISNLVTPQYRDAFLKLNADVFNGNGGKLQFDIIGLKGTKRHLETHAVPLKNAGNEVIALLGITRDITENKLAEELFRASEERYRYLFNNNPASIIIWDIDTLKILEANETAIELYGYSKTDFINLSVLNLRPKEEHSRFLELVQQQKNNDFTKKIMTWRHQTKSRVVFFIEIASHPIVYNGKKAILAIGNNVTEKVILENSLLEERELRQQQITDAVITGQEKERRQLGEELHDNINQILATTRLYLESALKEDPPRAKLILESKLLLEKAMMEIRKLSKSLLPPSLGEIGLLDALSDLIENFSGANSMKITKVWKDFPEDLLNGKLKLTLFRIVQEQLNNISKHAKAENVSIGLTKINDSIQLNIKDDGIGFDIESKKNGVGLRNMLSRAQLNNGTVTIKSHPGGGCELQVDFLMSKIENE